MRRRMRSCECFEFNLLLITYYLWLLAQLWKRGSFFKIRNKECYNYLKEGTLLAKLDFLITDY